MNLTELLPQLRELSRAEQLQIMQFLLSEIAKSEGVSLLEPGQTYPVWSPYDADEAANTLTQLLEEHNQGKNA